MTDSDAIERMQRGESEGLAQLYDRHATAVYSLALRIVRRPADAEDVTQDVFTQAWRSAARFDLGRGAPAAWLLMMARSRAIDCLRRRRDGVPVAGDGDITGVHIPDPSPSVEWRAATEEQVRLAQAAIEQLPAEQRTVVELAYYDGLTQSEIASRLASPLGTVKTRVRLGLKALRDTLANHGGTAPQQS